MSEAFVDFRNDWLVCNDELLAQGQFAVKDFSLQKRSAVNSSSSSRLVAAARAPS